MEFKSERLTAFMVGLIAGFIGVFNLLLVVMFRDEGAPLFLGVLGMFLILVSGVAFTFRKLVRIGTEGIEVERAIKALFWKRKEYFRVEDFEKIGITTATRGDIGSGPTTLYFVQLLGRKNVSIPGSSHNFSEILATARRISGFVNLPIDETPRIRLGVFGW
jgi:hypothetical protein